MADRIVPAVAGQVLSSRHAPLNGVTIKPKNEACKEAAGQWYCVTCDYPCNNNMDKDSHCRGKPKDGRVHALAWRCFGCGDVEVP